MKPPKYTTGLRKKDDLEADLHDLTNALAAARSFGEVLHFRLQNGSAKDPMSAEPLLAELDRMNDLLQNLRRRMYRPGDVLACRGCGYEFVFRKSPGKAASCARCKSEDVERWKPS